MKHPAQSLCLPKPVHAFFTAESEDSEAVSHCFTEDALVQDEGHSYQGRLAIQKWKTDASAKYQYTSTPFASEQMDDKVVVTSHLVGNFPGSPIDLQFWFTLEGEKIAALEIRP